MTIASAFNDIAVEQGGTVTSSGSIEDAGEGTSLITGDCTVTVS